MAETIHVIVEPTSFNVTAGDIAEVTAIVSNIGNTVDQFTFSIEGLEADWYNFSASSVALFPNDQETLKIFIHPEEPVEHKPGSYDFQLIVTPQEQPENTVKVALTLEVNVAPELQFEIVPQQITGRSGNYKVKVTNPGETSVQVHLDTVDDEAMLHYKLQPEELTVPANGQSESTLKVKLRWLDFFVTERVCTFQVSAAIKDSDEVKSIDGKLAITAWYRPFQKLKFPRISLPFLRRLPDISEFSASTSDRKKYILNWSVKRATKVTINDMDVEPLGNLELTPPGMTSYLINASNKYGNVTRTIDVNPVVIPVSETSDRIRVTLSQTEMEVHAGGGQAISTVGIQNMGDIVDKYFVEISGIETSWYNQSASSISLMPQDTGQVQLTFRPPKAKGVRSGVFPFAVTVRSYSFQEDKTVVIGQLEVLPSLEFTMSVAPIRISCRRKGRFRIKLINKDVTDSNISLDVSDYEEKLKFRLGEVNPLVKAWETVEVPVSVTPRRGKFVGENTRYDITASATIAEGNVQTVHCEMYHRPLLNSWRPVKILVGLILLFIVIHYVVGLGDGWDDLVSNPQEWFYKAVRHVRGWFS
ncbi:MAG: hypothetical protein JSU58_11130 [Dehalococcoidales bacterium]|nr:MAG: hypothetical protein JSU58_11130 [Dehalococcoidales bacterium]